MGSQLRNHKNARHYVTRLSYLQQQVTNGTIRFREIGTKDQISDIITADGLRLHPETIDAFRQNNGFARYWRVGFVVLALLLVASFIADF